MQPIFLLKNVTKRYGAFAALQNVSLSIEPGERVAIVGPSGAGKSTLISLLNGTQLPVEGEIWVLGQNLAALDTKRLRQVQGRIGTVYQQFQLVDNLRVVHNVNAGQLGHWPFWKAALSLLRPFDVDAAYEALNKVGISHKLYERTHRLSGGEQQRVALARVLVQDPDAILADEPVASLDPERSREIMDLFDRLVKEMGKTLVISLHAIEYAFSHCERIVGLRSGRILFDAPPSAVGEAMVRELYRIET